MRDKTMHVKRSYSDKIFDSVNVAVMIFLLIIFVWPLWFVVIASVSNPKRGMERERASGSEGFYADGL